MFKISFKKVFFLEEESEDVGEEFDPLDLMSAVNILDQLPKDFYEKVKNDNFCIKLQL